MEEPVIHSSAWTGPWDSGRRTVTADATWAKAREELYRLPPEVRKFLQMTWLVLIGTEATLWLISLVTRSAIQEQTISNSPDWLIGAGAFAAVATIGQLGAKTARFLWLRKAILFVAAVGGIGAAIWYSTTMLVARRYAVASAPERTFEYYVCRGRNCSGGYFLQIKCFHNILPIVTAHHQDRAMHNSDNQILLFYLDAATLLTHVKRRLP